MTASAPRVRLIVGSEQPWSAASLRPEAGHSEPASPSETCTRICDWSAGKAQLSLRRLILLGVLGGCYIGFGGALYTLVASEASVGYGLTRWIAGMAFSLGLILVVVGGAELSTGNCLMAVAWLRGRVRTSELWRNWIVSFLANAFGAALLAWLVVESGALEAEPVRRMAVRTAEAKLALPAGQAFWKGVLANILVCLAVWLAAAAASILGKTIGIIFPISAFVALGFEHSIANVYLISAGMLLGARGSTYALLANLLPVTLGNLVGGALLTSGILALAHSDVRAAGSREEMQRERIGRRGAYKVTALAAALIVIVSLLWMCHRPVAGFGARADKSTGT